MMNTKADKLKHDHSSCVARANDAYKDINKREPQEMFKKSSEQGMNFQGQQYEKKNLLCDSI